MILRFTSKEGQFRLTVEDTTTFPEILPQIAEKLPSNTDLQSVSVSNRPGGGDARKLVELQGVSFKQVNLTWVAFPSLPSQLTMPQTRRTAVSHLQRAIYSIKRPCCSPHRWSPTERQARRCFRNALCAPRLPHRADKETLGSDQAVTAGQQIG